jgi:DNA polymerase-3 subunit epsilon
VKNRPSFAIIDKGRTAEERSCIWVENGHFYGMGYIASDIGFADPSEIKDYITPYKSNQYIVDLILAYAEKYPGKVHFKLNEEE